MLLLLPAAGNAADDEAPPEAEASDGSLPRSLRSTGDDAAALAPIALSDARTLRQGEWALSYRYALVHYDDMRNGTHRVSNDELLQVYDETPRERDLQVHLFGVSYAPHRRVTLALQLPVVNQETKLVGGDPRRRFDTHTVGLGDLELRALVPFMRNGNQSLQIEMGLTAPTGSISERGQNADGDKQRLSFPQQLGSGTVDLLPGMVYRGRWESLSWGLLARGKFRVYQNTKHYRLGNEYLLSSWLAQSWTDWMSTSLRLSWSRRDSVHPEDDTKVNPEDDPKRQAGEYLDLGPGVNFRVPFLGGPRFGVEMTFPFFQTLKGPQIERDWQVTAGWQWVF